MSRGFAHRVTVEKPNWEVPFGPHACLFFKVARLPCEAVSWTLRRPKTLPIFEQTIAQSQLGRSKWAEALEEASAQLPEELWPEKLDRDLAMVYRAAELRNLNIAGVTNNQKPYLGRVKDWSGAKRRQGTIAVAQCPSVVWMPRGKEQPEQLRPSDKL